MALRSGFTISLWAAAVAHRVSEVFDANDEADVGTIEKHDHSAELETNSTAQGCTTFGCGGTKSGPAWTARLRGIKCSGMDDQFGQYDTLVTGGQCKASAISQGESKAKLNCYLCDVDIKGHDRRYATTGKCTANVVCSAVRVPQGDLPYACSSEEEDATRLGQIYGRNSDLAERKKHPDEVCRPCPKECRYCIYESWKMSNFKCVMETSGKEQVSQAPNTTKYNCGSVTTRSCSGISTWGGTTIPCSQFHRKAYCNHQDGPAYGVSLPTYENYRVTTTMMLYASSTDKALIGKASPDFTILKSAKEYNDARETGYYRIKFTGLKCSNPDFSPLNLAGETLDECVSTAKAEAVDLSKGANCALCDFQFEVDGGKCSAWYTNANFGNGDKGAKFARCSELSTDLTCYHDLPGRVGKFEMDLVNGKFRTNSKCLPCPTECNIGCTKQLPRRQHTDAQGEQVGNMNALSKHYSEFRCKIDENHVTDKDGKTTNIPVIPGLPVVKCGDYKHRTCSGGFFAFGCNKNQWNAVCDFVPDMGAHSSEASLNEHRDYEVEIKMGRTFTDAFSIFDNF